MASEVDLFGNEVETPERDTVDRPPINDMELVVTVLHMARRSGFVLTRCGAVRRFEDDEHVARVPSYIDQAVHQLLDAGWLTVGGTKGVHDGGQRTTARSVLMPQKSRQCLARWSALQKNTTSKGA